MPKVLDLEVGALPMMPKDRFVQAHASNHNGINKRILELEA